MDFSWTEEQNALVEDARRFAREELGGDVVARDAAGTFDRTLWKRAAEYGVLGWAVPKEHGGSGHDLVTAVRLLEALGEGCRDNGLTFGLGAQMWGVQTALLHFGTPEQIERFLPPSLAGDSLTAYCMTEEGSGSDAFGLAATAVREGGEYVLNADKVLITFGPVADAAIVFAKTNPDAGRWGISAFLVDASAPGYTAHPVEAKMGLRTVPFGRVTLEDVRVPADQLLGKEGAGASLFTFSQGWERSLVLAPQLGAMQRQIDECVKFARTRKRAGTSIGKHQAVSHRIADMKLRLETGRLLLYKTAWLQQKGLPNLMEAALTKTYLGECFRDSALAAIAIHGGDGYRTKAGIERDLRDAIGGLIYGGTTDIQRNIVAGLLGL
ncbi:Acyl-CoA dehydrogenase [Planctomycetes bacterium Poly30]|uniref:Acyl-CoA dehydrogenase n=1 Tax=Saltatorellus ferox TaxID=2528018 RepID=A0A518F199_9BACT|nr:Acyl-CoA dehydrogenase [Planctomycetes bacterium Poly30]